MEKSFWIVLPAGANTESDTFRACVAYVKKNRLHVSLVKLNWCQLTNVLHRYIRIDPFISFFRLIKRNYNLTRLLVQFLREEKRLCCWTCWESYDIKGRKMSHLLSLQISRLNEKYPTHVESFRQLPPFGGKCLLISNVFYPPRKMDRFPCNLSVRSHRFRAVFVTQGLYWYKHWRAGNLNGYQLGSWWDRRDEEPKSQGSI